MIKFIVSPDSSSYSVEDGDEVIRTSLNGGAGRYRKDVIKSTSTVSVTWIFNDEQYEYFRSFYRGVTAKGAIPFFIDLILDKSYPEEHRAYFMPKTVQLSSQQGCAYFVSTKLEVYPNEDTDNGDFAYIYGAIGPNWATLLDKLDVIVNQKWPQVL